MDRAYEVRSARQRGLAACADFKGVRQRLRWRGNYNLGLREQIIFPEIVYDKVDKVRGMDVRW